MQIISKHIYLTHIKPGNNVNEGIRHSTPKSQDWSLTTGFILKSWSEHSFFSQWGGHNSSSRGTGNVFLATPTKWMCI